MRTTIGLLLIGIVLSAIAQTNATPEAQPAAAPNRTSPCRYPWDSDEDYAARVRLSRPVGTITFDATPFVDVLDELSKRSGQAIRANWPALEAASIGKDKEVDFRTVSNMPVEKALRIILDARGGGEVELGYDVRDGIVWVSTIEDLSRNRRTVTYDCCDLLNADEADLAAHVHRVFAAVAKYCGRDLCKNPAEGEEVVRQTIEGSRETLRRRLVTAIQQQIDPESWRDAGGNVGSIDVLGDRLVVTQSLRTQERVFDFLEQLRACRSNRPGSERWP